METRLSIDGMSYLVRHAALPETFAPTVLCLVSYMPNEQTENLVRIAVASLRRHTTSPYTLCVVDNASPEERLAWLRQQKDVVLLENRTPPEGGSYANAIGLEIGRRMIPQDTRYFMSLHQDIMVTRDGWLEYLLGKFSEHVRAVGVREDRARVPEGILHVLGYIVDFQLLNALGLEYFPRLPHYDTGDAVIDGLRKHGFGYFATPNTQWDSELVSRVPQRLKGLIFKEHNINFAFDGQDEVFFLHLGRGVVKTTAASADYGGYIDAWFSTANELLGDACPHLFSCAPLNTCMRKMKRLLSSLLRSGVFRRPPQKKAKADSGPSQTKVFRADFVDERKSYIELQANRTLQQLARMDATDVARKRMRWESIETYLDKDAIKNALVVGCRNAVQLDILEEAGIKNVHGIDLVSVDERIFPCDMHNISMIDDASLDLIFASHSLEHALIPEKVLREFKRVLQPGGYVFIEVPIHFIPAGSDLHDFDSSDALEAMLMQAWGGGRCLLKQELAPEEIHMGTSVARVVFQAPA